MDWDAEVDRARRLKQEDLAAEQNREKTAVAATSSREAERHALCDALERVRNALIRADWPAAVFYRPGFVSYSKLIHTLRGQTYAEMRITEVTETIHGEGTEPVQRAATITYYKYSDIYDGHLVYVTAGLGGPMRDTFRFRDVKFVGTELCRLTPDLVIRAAARYCGENDVTLDVQ